MGNLIAKIVLTGGPCAGKTTTISRIEEHLIDRGYHVLVLNECATETIKSMMNISKIIIDYLY